MKKLISIMLCLLLFVSFAYCDPINQKPKVVGSLLIVWGIYATWVGYEMLFSKRDIKEGDWNLVGGLLMASGTTCIIWGVTILF